MAGPEGRRRSDQLLLESLGLRRLLSRELAAAVKVQEATAKREAVFLAEIARLESEPPPAAEGLAELQLQLSDAQLQLAQLQFAQLERIRGACGPEEPAERDPEDSAAGDLAPGGPENPAAGVTEPTAAAVELERLERAEAAERASGERVAVLEERLREGERELDQARRESKGQGEALELAQQECRAMGEALETVRKQYCMASEELAKRAAELERLEAERASTEACSQAEQVQEQVRQDADQLDELTARVARSDERAETAERNATELERRVVQFEGLIELLRDSREQILAGVNRRICLEQENLLSIPKSAKADRESSKRRIATLDQRRQELDTMLAIVN